MPIDSSLYAQFAPSPMSVNDYLAQRNKLAQGQQALQLGQADIDAIPLRNKLLSLQASSADIANQQNQLTFAAGLPFLQRFAQKYGATPSPAQGGAGTPGVPGTPGSGGNDDVVTQTTGQGGGAPVTRGMLASMDPDDLSLAIKYGFLPKESLGLWQDIKFGRQLQPGYRQNADGSTSYLADPSKGITIDPRTNQVSTLPGAPTALGAVAQATKAGETAGANTQTMAPETRLGIDGRPLPMTVAQLVSSVAPQPAQQPQGVQPSVGGTTATPFDGLSPNEQAVAIADMKARGQPLSSMSVNGQPALANLQSQLDAAKSTGPEGVAQFQAQMLPKILAIQDPAARQKALAGFTADLQTPPGTPIHSLASGGSQAAPTTGAPLASPPMGGAAGGPPVMIGPGEAAALRIKQENAAKLDSQPAVTSADTQARNDQDSFKTYSDKLNEGVTQGLYLQQRNAEIRANMQQFQTGLSGGHLRTDVATNLANLFPNNQAIQAAAHAILGGGADAITAATTFNNLIAGAAVTNANQVLDGNGHLNRQIVGMLKEGAESARSDPAALARIMDVQDNLVNQMIAEQKYVAQRRSSPGFNAGTLQSDWAQQQQLLQKDPSSPFFPVSLRPSAPIRPSSQAAPSGFKYLGKQ